MTPQTVLALDWNGTVVADAPRALRALRVALGPSNGAPRDLAGFRGGFQLPLTDWFTSIGVAADELVATEQRWNAELAREEAPLSPGALSLLGWCADHGVEVHIVTGAQRDVVTADAARLGITHHITGIVAGAHPKSDALQGWSPRRVVYVGDTEYDLDQARIAQAIPVAFTGGYRPADALRSRNPRLVARCDREAIHPYGRAREAQELAHHRRIQRTGPGTRRISPRPR